MSQITQLQPQWTDDELAILDRVQRLRNSLQSFGNSPPPTPIRYRHQFANFDFWFMFLSMCATFAIFTSFIPTNAFEPILAAAMFLQFCALIANLTRERVELEPKINRPRQPLIVINFTPRPTKTFREAQVAAGIKIVEN